MKKVGIPVFCIHLEYIRAIRYILWPVGNFCFGQFGNFWAIWYTFPRFGILSKEKSGNPERVHKVTCSSGRCQGHNGEDERQREEVSWHGETGFKLEPIFIKKTVAH
jgi:hypothetical protein